MGLWALEYIVFRVLASATVFLYTTFVCLQSHGLPFSIGGSGVVPRDGRRWLLWELLRTNRDASTLLHRAFLLHGLLTRLFNRIQLLRGHARTKQSSYHRCLLLRIGSR